MEVYYTNEMILYVSTRIPFTKNMSNPKPDCPTKIKTSIPRNNI